MIRQQLSRVHCRHGAWRAQCYVVFCLNVRTGVTVLTTSWTKESNFYKIKPLLIGQLQRKVCHRVCQSLICSSEKSEPHLFPYSRVVVRFVACCGYNVDRCSFAPKDGVSRQKTRPNVLLPKNAPGAHICCLCSNCSICFRTHDLLSEHLNSRFKINP